MGIGVKWANEEKTALLITFEGHWAWNDVHEMDASL